MPVRTLAGLALSGAAALAWGLAESRFGFVVRTHVVPTRAPRAMRVLHISDLHLTDRDQPRIDFIRGLAALQPDFVAVTGDNFGDHSGPAACLRALGPLLDRPGAFSFGSHDYVSGAFKSPLRYFGAADSGEVALEPDLPADDFSQSLVAHGWSDLNNSRAHVSAGGMAVSLVGVDDPHVGLDDYPDTDGDHGDIQIALIHAPYRRVLDETWRDGTDLTLCGHTHGGQVCVPLYGALVNNADVPLWRSSGLQGWPGRRPDGTVIEPMRALSPARRRVIPQVDGAMWLNVSAGVGASPHAPVRFACRPEVSLLQLVPR